MYKVIIFPSYKLLRHLIKRRLIFSRDSNFKDTHVASLILHYPSKLVLAVSSDLKVA